MISKFLRVASLLLFAILITIGAVRWYDGYLSEQLKNLSIDSTKTSNGLKAKVSGTYLLQKGLDERDFMLIGSSELSSAVPENPRYMFPNQNLPYAVNMVGSAYTQSLLDGVRFGCLDLKKDDKLAIVVSYQWFFDDDINAKGTQAHFSELQFYEFLQRRDISEDDKKYACRRFAKLLKGEGSLGWPFIYSKLRSYDNVIGNTLLTMLNPVFATRYQLLKIKDKRETLKFLEAGKSASIESHTVDWKQEYVKAEKLGRESCTNNDFYVNDEYYDTYIRRNIENPDKHKIKREGARYLDVAKFKSKEYDDYRFLLKVLKDKGVKPYIIFMSVNGRYYDRPGIGMRESREAYYDKLGEITREYGFEYLDLRDYEYEPYFYVDVMHLGWKGWLYVNEQCSKYFGKSSR